MKRPIGSFLPVRPVSAARSLSPFGRRRTRSQSLVEFALVLPIFLAVLIAILEFGWVIFTYNTVNHAALGGARRGQVLTRVPGAFQQNGNSAGAYNGLLPCDVTTVVGTVACRIQPLDRSRATARINTPNPATPTAIPGLPVEVRVDYTYQPLFAGWLPGLPGLVLVGSAETSTQ